MKRKNVVIEKNCKSDKTAKLCVMPERRIKVRKLIIGNNTIIKNDNNLQNGTQCYHL